VSFDNTVYNREYKNTDSIEWVMRCDTGGYFQSEVTALTIDNNGDLLVGDMLYWGVDCGYVGIDGRFSGMSDCNPSLWKFDSNGNVLFHVIFTNSTSSCLLQQFISEIRTDSDNNIYITGYMLDLWNLKNGTDEFQLVSNGYTDALLIKFDSNGNFIWGVNWGSDRVDGATDLALDNEGNIYIAGHYFSNVDFDPGSGEEFRDSGPYLQHYVSKFSDGGNFLWVYTWAGAGMDIKLALDSSDTVFVLSGSYDETSVDLEQLADQRNSPSRSGNSVLNLSTDGDILKSYPVNGRIRDFTICEDKLFFVGDEFRDYDLLESGESIRDEHSQAAEPLPFLLSQTPDGEYLDIETWRDNSATATDICSDLQRIFVSGRYRNAPDLRPGHGDHNYDEPPGGGSYSTIGSYVMVFDRTGVFEKTIVLPIVTGYNSSAITNGGQIYLGGSDHNSSGIIVKSMPLEE
jgi:hypothetical protein